MAESRSLRRPVRLVLLLPVLGVVALLIGGALGGLHAYVLESPSMGEAAPVSTLVLATTRVGALQVGDVITYQPPDHGVRPFTHRVVAVVRGGVQVRVISTVRASMRRWCRPPCCRSGCSRRAAARPLSPPVRSATCCRAVHAQGDDALGAGHGRDGVALVIAVSALPLLVAVASGARSSRITAS